MSKIIAIMGKSGSGKDTIVHKLVEKYPNDFNEIISCTTRPIREGEAEGVNYFYLTDQEFNNKVVSGDMLESTEFNNWYYGTSLKSLDKFKTNIGVFNPDGVRALIRNENIDLIIFQIICDDKTRLLRQLNREEHPDTDEIVRRYGTDKEDFKNLEFNTIKIKNDDGSNIDREIEYIKHVYEAINV